MEKIINIVSTLSQFDAAVVLFKLFLIAILSGIIGWERESWNKPAGLRTHVLLGSASVLVCCVGLKMAEITGADASRIPAQLLSGIGFLGAGTILRDGSNIKGLTTATTLLTVTCIGLCVGMGYYIAGIIGTLIVYLILSYSHVLSDKLEKITHIKLDILCDNPKETITEIKEILTEQNLDILKLNITNKKDALEIEARCHNNLDKNTLISALIKVNNVNGIDKIELDRE